MNRVLNIFGSLLAIAWATTSCQEEIESVVPGASSSLTDKTVTVEFGAPCSTKGTLEVTTTDITKMTVAFYKKSSGTLAVKSPMTEGNRVTVSAANLDEDCSVYAMGNLSEYSAGDEVPWPSNVSGLADLGVNPINTVMPKANSVEWILGTPKVNLDTEDIVELMKQVVVDNSIPKTGSETRTIKSIKVTGVPSKIYPFGSASSTGDETADEATASDIAKAQTENNKITLYVPTLSSSSKIITTVERKDGSGITKHETYTKTLSEEEVESNTTNNPILMSLEGVSDPATGLTVDIVNEDTRSANFGTSALSVYGDGTGYTTTIKATAKNGDENWTYVLGWTGNSSATGTKISCYEGTDITGTPVTKDLTSSGYFQIDAGKTYTLKITSSYTGSTQQTVKLNCTAKNASGGNINLVDQDGNIASMSCVFAPVPPIVITVLEHTGDGNIYIDFSCSEPIPSGSLGIGASYNAYTANNRSWFEENYALVGYTSPGQYFSYADANFKADPSTYSGTTSISAGATGGTLTIPAGNNKTIFLYRNAVYTTVNSTGRNYTIQYYKDYSRNGSCLTYSYYSSGSGSRPAECLGTLDYRSGYKVIDSQMGTDYKQLKIRFTIDIDNSDAGSYVSANRFNEYRTNWDFTVKSNTNGAALGSGTSCYQSTPFMWTASGYDVIEATTVFYGTTPTETSRGGFTTEDIYQYQWLVKFVDNKVVVNSYGDYYLLNYVGTVTVN